MEKVGIIILMYSQYALAETGISNCKLKVENSVSIDILHILHL